jgi:uncharacterized protein YndB with AHSA1/START domain
MHNYPAEGLKPVPAKTFTATCSTAISATATEVWNALTDPKLIKQYLFGTDVITDWQVGSPILYRGVWQGQPYEDKGRVMDVEPERRLITTFWSSLSGLTDSPENYYDVTYDLTPDGDGTKLTVTQGNIVDENDRKHAEDNWNEVLKAIKALLESRTA